MAKRLSELIFASAGEAARAIREGVVSSLQLTKHILKRIDRYNPALNAVITLLKDEALERASAADEALTKGQLWGPLHGVPCTVKDTFEMAGIRTTAGSPALTDHIPKVDATVVARLRDVGAVIIGHTNTPLMAGDVQTFNEIFGTTNNPWDLTRTPGGSTGGGAAALAAGLSFISIGSDIGGSIRTPAHFCGVYGHKPSLGVIPLRGHIPPPPGVPFPPSDLVVAGPLARSASDLKLVLEVIGGPDREDAIAYSWSLPPARKTRLTDYRVGYVVDDPICPVSSDVKEVLLEAIEALHEVGVRLEEGWPPDVDPSEQYDTYRFLLFSATRAYRLRDEQFDELREQAAKKDGRYETIVSSAMTSPHKHFQAASVGRMTARAAWQEFFRTHDAFLIPTAFVPAFPHDHRQPAEERRLSTPEGSRFYWDITFWITFATLSGLPATTAPIGLTSDDLPVGIQIMGPYLEDATPIDFAGRLAEVVGGFRRPQGY
jgi:amidase